MSWNIDLNTSAITMHRGDTGAYYACLALDSEEPFEDGDVAIYEVCQGSIVKIHREFSLYDAEDDEEIPNGKQILIAFRNSDTDTWNAGTYQTEIRVVLNPKRIGTAVKDGDVVRTPPETKSTLTIVGTLIDI